MFVLMFYSKMAKDEMETITEDQWDDEIWGVEKNGGNKRQKPTKLIFYFGQNVSFDTSLPLYGDNTDFVGRIIGLQIIPEML